MKAQLCPVCGGSGKYPAIQTPGNLFKLPNKPEVTPKDQKQCHGCLGKGWIMLPESKPFIDYPSQGRPLAKQPNKEFTRI